MTVVSLADAAQIIRQGGVIAYPTESCYGLGCDPDNNAAVKRILHIKRRHWNKGLILISDHRCRLNKYIDQYPAAFREEILASWPGPFTWLLPATRRTSRWLRGSHSSIAVRVTAHRDARSLCRTANMALVSTSANRAGRPALRSKQHVIRVLSAEVDGIMEGDVGQRRTPSEIRDGASGRLVRA